MRFFSYLCVFLCDSCVILCVFCGPVLASDEFGLRETGIDAF